MIVLGRVGAIGFVAVQRRVLIDRRDRVVPLAAPGDAVSLAPLTHDLEVDVLALDAARPTPLVRSRMRVGEKRTKAGVAEQPGIDADELAIGVERSVRGVHAATRMQRRVEHGDLHQPARLGDHRTVEIGGALRERDLVDVLGIDELAGIGGIIADIVERHAFQRVADLVLTQPVDVQAQLLRQPERIGHLRQRARRERHILVGVLDRRLRGDESLADRADGFVVGLVLDQSGSGIPSARCLHAHVLDRAAQMRGRGGPIAQAPARATQDHSRPALWRRVGNECRTAAPRNAADEGSSAVPVPSPA